MYQNQLSAALSIISNAIVADGQGISSSEKKRIGLILGSGLGLIAKAAHNPVVIPYGEIPGFHVSDVEGHAGQLVIGNIGDCTAMIMQGRFHYYEGVSMERLAFPIDLMEQFGAQTVIITSASGGVNTDLERGDIMVLDDHINFMFKNPLHGSRKLATGANIPSVKSIYNDDLKQLAFDVAAAENINLKRGIYLMVEGPSYETRAEIKMVRKLGGDVVGMSTVPEALAAHHNGMKVLGITYVSNMASGMAPGPLVHSHVIETMEIIRDDVLKLIIGIINKL